MTVCCRISRDKRGLEGGLFPSYFLHLERQEDGRRFFLLAARRKRRATTCNYLISLDATTSTTISSPLDSPGDGRLTVGHLRSNFLGTQFILLSTRSRYASLHASTGHPNVDLASGDWSKEIATISYVSLVASFFMPLYRVAAVKHWAFVLWIYCLLNSDCCSKSRQILSKGFYKYSIITRI